MNRFRIGNDKGFTLPEVLLVLMLSALLIGIPPAVSASYVAYTEEKLFMEQVQSSIALIQNYAILNEQATRMITFPSNRQIRFTVPGDKTNPVNHTLYLPDTVSMPPISETYEFKRGSGNLENFDTLVFNVGKKQMELAFQMGSGRYEIREAK